MLNKLAKAAGVGFATTLALAATANNAQALDFTFSFDNGFGSTPGTVKGNITGLNEGTGAANSVIITDYPAGLGGTFDEGNDATLWSNQTSNSFTVSSGSITAANFGADSNTGDDVFCLNCGSYNGLTLDDLNTDTVNDEGFAGATYSAATPVPFGVSTDLSIIILGSLYGASRLHKRIAAGK